MRPLIYAALAASSLLLSACESVPKTGVSPEPTYEQAQHNAFNAANYGAVAELLKRYPAAPATASNFSNSGGNAPFIVATLVNIDQLEQSSTLGRLISEQVASRMTQMGYGVLELKVRNGIYMKRNEGELLLTRGNQGSGDDPQRPSGDRRHLCRELGPCLRQSQDRQPGHQRRARSL